MCTVIDNFFTPSPKPRRSTSLEMIGIVQGFFDTINPRPSKSLVAPALRVRPKDPK